MQYKDQIEEIAFKTTTDKNIIRNYEDNMISKWSFEHEEININTGYGNTFILGAGSKKSPPLILLHGSGMSSIMWLKDIEQYAKKYRVYAIDILGEVGKSDGFQLPLDDDSYAHWLNEIFSNLSIDKATIIGISLGGWIATKFSILNSSKVSKLILLSPSGIGSQKRSFLFKYLCHMIQGQKGSDKLYKKVNGNQPMPESILKYQRLILKGFNYRKGTIPIFSDNELKKLNMPLVIFLGGKDIMLDSYKTASRIKELHLDAKVNLDDDLGHSNVNDFKKIIQYLE